MARPRRYKLTQDVLPMIEPGDWLLHTGTNSKLPVESYDHEEGVLKVNFNGKTWKRTVGQILRKKKDFFLVKPWRGKR